MIIIDKQKKIIFLLSKELKISKFQIILNDINLENKLVSSFYLIEKFLKEKEIIQIQIKLDFIEIDFISDSPMKLKSIKTKTWKNEIKEINLLKKHNKKYTIIFHELSQKFENFNINFCSEIEYKKEILNDLFLKNLSTFELDDKKINRLQIKILNEDIFLKNDHRKINKRLKFFTFHYLNGIALPIWLPNGELVKNLIKNYIRELERKNNFIFITTPIIANKKLFEISGHYKHYKNAMFSEIKDGINSLILRPMTCPQHCLFFDLEKRSYKELPLRVSENSLLFRYESSGSLSGLERVRQMELKDTHVFISKETNVIKNEIKKLFKMTVKVIKTLGIKIEKIYLSFCGEKEKEKYYQNFDLWFETQKILYETLTELKIDFILIKGEAAFYGPKIDFQIKSVLEHDITVSTIQLDFLLPKKFKLKYRTNSQDKEKLMETPILIHHGIFGTYERLISILLEQNNGWLPFWLSPKQIAILPVTNNNNVKNYCRKIIEMLEKYEIRVKFFNFNNNLNSNIKECWIQKIPFQIVVGENEVEEKKIIVSHYMDSKNKIKINIFEFIEQCKINIMNKK